MRKGRRKAKISALAALAAVMLALALYFYPTLGEEQSAEPDAADGEVQIYFIDVGQGDSALICSDEASVLIDAGPGSSADSLVSFVESHTEELDYMVLTHPHEDHIGGADDILSAVSVKRIIMPDASSESKTFSKLLDAIEVSGAEVIEAVSGDEYEIDGIRLTILAPNSASYSNTNDYSVVTRLEYGGFSVMFTGDAETASENEILDTYGASMLKCTLLKAGHHGSSTSTSESFLKAVSPEAAIISCGRNNDYGHPHRETLQKLGDIGADIYRTDEDGTITVITDGRDYAVQREND
jgi:competence protein ComEC